MRGIGVRAAGWAGVSLLALMASAAVAQEQTAQANEAAAEVGDTIVVTGSRIARDPNAIAPLPVATIDTATIRASGQSDVTAVLREIPALLSSGTVADSIERGAGGVGQATLNLRQLGANRTLVLVDGRRHVSGVAGSQTVDVATIPRALVERVEVLTGGASAIYGADAVTGVVNYILKRDFDGIELDAESSISSRGDGHSFRIDATVGRNFRDNRGNVTLSAGYTRDAEVLLGDRPFTRDNGRWNNSTTYGHPDRRFQRGDINAATMPNFAAFYTTDNGFFPYGFEIPTDDADIADSFPGGLTSAERALVDRARNAPLFKLGAQPVFAISSNQGLVFRRDFDFFSADINNNGINDCEESFIGFTGFGGGGCYVTTPGGGVRIFQDGVIATDENQFGGDGALERTNQTSLIPQSERFFANLVGRYEFSSAFEAFWDVKYARNKTLDRNSYNTFYDSLLIFADNPFIPGVLQEDADDARGLRVSRDFTDLGPGITRSTRETWRLVGGLRGEIASNLRYDFGLNWGRTDSRVTDENTVLYDRLFAAIDVVRGPDGQPACRSSVNPNAPAHPGSQFFPVIRGGFFTFRPGDGQCRPANILAGSDSVSAEAAAFITQPITNRFRLEQFVSTLVFTGDTATFLNLPGGPVGFAFGGEYREERSRSLFDPLQKGLLPEGSPAGPAGTFIGTIEPRNQSLVFDAQTRTFDLGGKFDVKEVFGELLIPILRGVPWAEDLTIGGAARYADYSTTGGAFTWNINGVWAPARDIRFRGTYSQAIRAPNISELFNPEVGVTFRPSDPCNQATIDALIRNNDPNAQNRLNNCRADGIPAGFRDPLTARFNGVRAGNPDLAEEKAKTWTVGGVLQPRFVPGLTVSVDYYSIEIEDAIAVIAAQDIVNTCYDLDTFPNQFCSFFTRNRDSSSQTFLGFNFLRQQELNFGRIETSGIDFSVNYRWSLDDNNFSLNLIGNWTEKLNRFFDPLNSQLVNPGLGEFSAPEWAGTGSFTWNKGPFSFTWRTQYVGKQAIASAVQIERVDFEFGPDGIADAKWIHGASVTIDMDDRFSVSAGVSNLTNEEPFPASSAYPVSGLGRSFFMGVRGKF